MAGGSWSIVKQSRGPSSKSLCIILCHEVTTQICQNSTVLVVEDNPLARIALAEHLRGIGYRMIEAGSADEAISALSSGSRVNVVFADVELPGSMGGFSDCRQHARHLGFEQRLPARVSI